MASVKLAKHAREVEELQDEPNVRDELLNFARWSVMNDVVYIHSLID